MVKSHEEIIDAARSLSDALRTLSFSDPVAHVYDPLEYARTAHEIYLSRFGGGLKKIVFLGMNPGPFGMAQTGVPFGEIAAVRDWMSIRAAVSKPAREHPKRPILGFDCDKSEVSGRRLWGLFAQRYGAADLFFKDHFVTNYCPLVFMAKSGANVTPDKVSASEMEPVFAACDAHLRRVVEILQPEWLIGVGGFAEGRAKLLQPHFPKLKVARILHPSPASPAANKDWAGNVTRTMEGLGIW
ncbi:MAG: single-stranded DNA-binding protein [Verrucomicrobia bacterium]|nr:single-stranded DNA-binding protein [Verrucomicrobiota bacterium]